MDTNLVAELVRALAAQKAVAPSFNMDFWYQLIPAVGAFILAGAAWMNSKAGALYSKTAADKASAAADAAEATKKLAVETTVAVGDIAVSVNGKTSAMQEKINSLTADVLRLSEKSAGLEAKQEAAEKA